MAKYEDIHRSLVQTVAPSGDVVTDAEAKAYANISHADDDTLVGALTDAAEQVFESRTRRQLLSATWRQNLDAWPHGPIYLPWGPVSSVTTVKHYDADGNLQTVTSTNYHEDLNSSRARIVPISGFSWPTLQAGKIEAVEITYVSGYTNAAAVPEKFKQAIKGLAAYWYRIREPIQETNFMRVPMHLGATMDSYRIWEF